MQPGPRVVIVCDASRTAGSGHVGRCLAIAEELRLQGAQLTWFVDLDDVTWARVPVTGNAERVNQPDADPDALQAHVVAAKPDVVLVDSYLLPKAFGERILAAGVPILSLTDPATPHRQVSEQWIPGFGFGAGAADSHGPQRVLLRGDIRRRRRADPVQPPAGGSPWRVGVVMGGVDSPALTRGVVEALRLVDRPLQIHINSASGHRPCGPHDVRVHALSPEFWDVLEQCHVVITAAGVSAWEVLYVGVPCVLVQTADNQEINYWGMTSRGWALAGGTAGGLGHEPRHVAQGVLFALEQWDLSVARVAAAQAAVDGLGVQRCCQRLGDLAKVDARHQQKEES